MINIDCSDPVFLELSPRGTLQESDFDEVAEAIDRRAQDAGKPPNLVIKFEGLPHWANVSALTRHFQFIRSHHKVIAKVAAVGDPMLLSAIPAIADRLVEAKIRHFPAAKLDDARAWARASDDHPGHFAEIGGLPDDVLALRAVGIITAQDYRDNLIPLMAEKLRQRLRINCLFLLDEAFIAYSGDAIWSDVRFGLRHARDFERVAVVTDVRWITHTAQLLSPLMPFYCKVFPLAELDQAKAWIQCQL